MFARVSATISTERRVGNGAVVCCRAEAKEYRHGLSTMVSASRPGAMRKVFGRCFMRSVLELALSTRLAAVTVR
jgi:hypothetical protein